MLCRSSSSTFRFLPEMLGPLSKEEETQSRQCLHWPAVAEGAGSGHAYLMGGPWMAAMAGAKVR